MATSDLVRAWVLHRRPYRNTSLMVDLFLAQAGRITGVTRGGQRDPHWQPFRPLLVSYSGRGDLVNLQQVEANGPALALQGEAMYCGLYLNELLCRVLQRSDAHPALFEAYETALSLLADPQLPRDVVLRHFELRLLDDLGYGLALERVSSAPEYRYRLQAEQGLVADQAGTYSGAVLHDIACGHWHDEARRLARDLMREALAPLLGGRPLVSRSLFRHAGKGES